MSTESTKQRLLSVACAVFAERGFRDATIAEICDRADANIAAVNYHFRDKESLYDACWRHAFEAARAAWPLDGGVAASAPADERLRAFIRALMSRVMSDGECGQFPRLMVKEMAEPTAALNAIATEVIEPQRRVLHGIVAELVGVAPDDPRVVACGFSVISQCAFFAFGRAMRERLLRMDRDHTVTADRVSDHVWRFSLAGIRAIARGKKRGEA